MSHPFPHLNRLIEVLRTLRGPEGCPWDRKQTLASAARYLADEVHEYVEAAQAGDPDDASKELADLLYMVGFNWLLLAELREVTLDDLAGVGVEKLIRRHPHVFGDAAAESVEDSRELWEQAKADESGQPKTSSALKDLAASASPLRQAWTYGDTAAAVAFDWDHPDQILAKVHEELGELAEARATADPARIHDELGDVLFAVTQLARKLEIDPDAALTSTNRKFSARFREVERRLGPEPEKLRAAGVTAMMETWEEIKREERSD